ncbi:unnamed protein product [Clonostachys chloroleuca]|uniref:Major facilitator superfamily (MFS) profile domain-containing protein n=1 Tax=Clonostachys chloroleuca TaxID=1926264 RepID=A0AA35MA09_9HYPO|nr:unnamed protein product [Clonostachys chloroleuca]
MQVVFWQQIIIDLDVTYDQLNAGVAANSAGLAAGCVLFIPLTRKYGCRSTYILSTAVMASVSWWSSRMTTATEIYITNFLFGLAGSLNETISEITIADLFFTHQRGTANGLYIVAVVFGNFVCPTIAGVQAAALGWRWTYYTVGICLTVLFLLFCIFFEETKYVPIYNAEPPDDALRRPIEIDDDGAANPSRFPAKDVPPHSKQDFAHDIQGQDQPSLESQPPTAKKSYVERLRLITNTDEPLWRNYITPFKMARFPHVLFTAVQVANALAFIVLLTSTNSMVFSAAPYNFDTSGVGLMLMGPFVGNILGSLYGGLLGDWVVVRLAKRNGGIFEPEMRLYILPFPAICQGAGLALYGVAADRGWHWIYPSIGGAIFGFGAAAMMDVSCTIVIDIYQNLTAEAFILITFIRNVPAIGVPFGVVSWIESAGLTKLYVIGGCVSSAVCLLCVPLIYWGRRIRKASWGPYESILQQHGFVGGQ